MLHTNAREHFEKLTRVRDRLRRVVHKDDLDDFFKSAYHLIENIEKDPATGVSEKSAATALRSDPEIELCREIANKEKHYRLDPKRHPRPRIASATICQGYGIGRYGVGFYGEGEQSVVLLLKDGTHRDALELVEAVYPKFAKIFP